MKTSPFRRLAWFTLPHLRSPRFVAADIFHKRTERNPRLWDARFGNEGGFNGPKDRAFVQAEWDRIARAVPAIVARIERRAAWVANQNAATLAAMDAEIARAALGVESERTGPLYWHERLPYGITAQAAADATGLSFWQSFWSGSVQTSTLYQPGARPRKSRMFAKAI